jgi:hypothetical protein
MSNFFAIFHVDFLFVVDILKHFLLNVAAL